MDPPEYGVTQVPTIFVMDEAIHATEEGFMRVVENGYQVSGEIARVGTVVFFVTFGETRNCMFLVSETHVPSLVQPKAFRLTLENRQTLTIVILAKGMNYGIRLRILVLWGRLAKFGELKGSPR